MPHPRPSGGPAPEATSSRFAHLIPILPWLGALLFTAVLGAIAAHHEMWRDEMQAWLFARDSPTIPDMLHAMRYEGHPPLWHLLLWPIAHLTHNPAWMQVLHVLIAGTSALLVLRYAPFPWPVRVLLIAGYFFSYEWAAISRNYALAALMTFALCALYPKRRKHYVAFGALLGLLCLTHAGGLLIALALAATVVLEFVLSAVRDRRQPYRAFAAGVVLGLLGLFAAVRQASPPAEAEYAHPARLSFDAEDGRKLAQAVFEGYLPVPIDRRMFWNSNIFVGSRRAGADEPFRVPEHDRILVGASLLVLGALLVASRPWALLPFALATLAELAFMHAFFFGDVRHHGFLFLALVAAFWISYSHEPLPGRAFTLLDRWRVPVFASLLVVHVYAAWVAIRIDWQEPFSQARAASRWIAAHYPDPDSAIFVGIRSTVASPVVGYVPLHRMYYPDRGEFGSYILFDRARMHRPDLFAPDVFRLMQDAGKPAVLVLSHKLSPENGFGGRARLAARFAPAICGDESYWIYIVRES